MEVVLLLVIGVFLIYRMMQVEERMNKMERASKLKEQNEHWDWKWEKFEEEDDTDEFWESNTDKIQNDTEYRDTDGWDEEMEKRYWAEQIPKSSITPKNAKEMMITKPDDFYGKIDFDDELEEQFWNEQPPEPFATPEEVEKYNIDGKK